MRAWLACAMKWPSGTRSATHTAPFSKPPLPMNSMYQTSPVVESEIEKPSMSLA